MKARFAILASFALLAGCHKDAEPVSKPSSTGSMFSAARKYPLKDLKESTIKVNGKDIKVWVMDDEGKRQEGMMFLDVSEVEPNHGMLFLFPKASDQSFWMHDCIMELDIAFISADKKVLNVVVGKQQDDSPLPSKGPAKYVLELRAGDAKPLGVVAGASVEIPADLEVTK